MTPRLALLCYLLLIPTHVHSMPVLPHLTMIMPWGQPDWNEWFHASEIITPFGTCSMSMNRYENNAWATADIVVYTWNSYLVDERIPPRPPMSLWVYLIGESPFENGNRNNVALKALNGTINVMMTYQRIATVHAPFGRFTPRAVPLDTIPSNIFPSRSKLAVIVMSNCDSRLRNDQLKILQKYIDIDVIGKCGNIKDTLCDARSPDCYTHLAKTYYYYVAFENSDCADYITEKTWRNSLQAGMVPIVWSLTIDHASMLPPHSYISLMDYSSIKAAAGAISTTAQHAQLYQRYHTWRKYYDIEVPSPIDHAESLCKYAHQHRDEAIPPIDLYSMRSFKRCNMNPAREII